MGFCVVTDSRNNEGEVLIMVDRAVQKKSFWSNQMRDALIYTSKTAADRKAESLMYNNPRVLQEDDARRILAANPGRYSTVEDHEYDEPELLPEGWDEHKIA